MPRHPRFDEREPNGARERGVVIIWFALFLTLLLAFVALGVDLAKLMATRTQLQNAADAAALAGASYINPVTGALDQTIGRARAQATAANNVAFIDDPQPVIVDAADVVYIGTDKCKVTTRRQGDNGIVTYFAKVLGLTRLTMTATATAKMDSVSTVSCRILPLSAIPLSPATPFVIGEIYDLKAPGGAGAEGFYGSLQLPACLNGEGNCFGNPNGASQYNCLMQHPYCCPVDVGQVVPTQSGAMSGPNTTGIQYLFSMDLVQQEYITYDQYVQGGGNGARLVVIPITTAEVAGSVTITGFGTFFLRNIPGNGNGNLISGEFVYAQGTGYGTYTGNGPVVFALRLVE